eukprot:CAMPEP_0203879346 /NCGR_PEP_ID=MMETSP0359-20131031/23831_1 /ASSEMBLY_ACC=CAM_ASM_000338 /TAXON_ID=268821 /ORGANISM="Scrippsiella Hangoei, Strain SHTV-5" /LENGTH=58 /DNA_ID=CAMNT_0050798753 /DNA_START=12 /DNA_END=185 /DNA_ORIENTATION=-
MSQAIELLSGPSCAAVNYIPFFVVVDDADPMTILVPCLGALQRARGGSQTAIAVASGA